MIWQRFRGCKNTGFWLGVTGGMAWGRWSVLFVLMGGKTKRRERAKFSPSGQAAIPFAETWL
jgi:hypothetical protein